MEHCISINIKGGIGSTLMTKAPLGEVLKEALSKAPDCKEDCWLMSNGYKETTGLYTREEFNFQWIDTILIDCDNGDDNDPTTWDKDIIEKFKQEHEPYTYFLWETFSSTSERPKFRAILLLDKKIEWINEPEKFTKRAIQQHFAKYTDLKASWFFTPPKGKVSTFVAHRGKPYPSSVIENKVKVDMMFAQMEEREREIKASRNKFRPHNTDGWRNLPSVKKCLEGLHVGERDNALCAACYAMDKNGYRSSIREFLDECDVEREFKNKWKSRYR